MTRSSLSLVLIGALACAQSGSGASGASAASAHAAIRVTNLSLEPELVEVGAEGTVVWINETDYAIRISFASEVAGQFTCQDLRPTFVVSGDRLVSSPIERETDDLELPCPLQPGRYDYEAGLSETVGFEEGGSLDTLRSLRGQIVVK